jgi:lysozyme
MRTSNVGIELIKLFESLHDGDLSQIGLQPKLCPSGIWTSGWGNAIIYNGKFLRGAENKDLAYAIGTLKNEAEADAQLQVNLRKFERIVSGKLKVKVNQNQFDALVSHTYNTGGSNTLFRLINENAGREKIYNWFTTKYITGNGVKLNGLVRRRKAEADLFFSK